MGLLVQHTAVWKPTPSRYFAGPTFAQRYFLFVSNYFLFGEEFPDFLLEYFIRTDQPVSERGAAPMLRHFSCCGISVAAVCFNPSVALPLPSSHAGVPVCVPLGLL